MFHFKPLILITLISLVFSSCSFSNNEENAGFDALAAEQPPNEAEADEPALVEEDVAPEESFVPSPGGVIKIDSRNPKTFNPILNEELSVDRLLRLIYEPLVALDESIKPAPAIASSWEFSPDEMTLTLHIRENAFWEDGEAITADDVVYTLNSINSSPETALYKKCLVNIRDYSSADAKTVKINYERPFSGALYNLTFPVIPRHHFSLGRPGAEITEPLGSGLYKLEEYNIMREIRLTASETSYREKAQIPAVTALIVREISSSLYAYEQNIIDIVETGLVNWKKVSTSRQSNIFRSASPNYEFIALNFRNSALQNINIRRAIAHSLPKTEIIDKFYSGNAFATETPVNPQSWLYEPDVITYGYDTERAKACVKLAEENFPDGIELSILVNDDNAERMLTAKLLVETLSDAGISCLIESCGFEDYSERIISGDYDMAVCGLQMPQAPDLTPLLGHIGGIPGEYNFASYKDDAMDGYLAQASVSVFESAQSSSFSAVQKRFAEELPHISILYKANVVLTGKNVSGDVKPSINNAYNNIGELMIKH